MNKATTNLKIVSPERAIVDMAVEMAILPGVDGDLGILPGHSSLVSSLRSGEIVVYQAGKVAQRLFVFGGFATINADSISILAEDAIDLASVNADSIAKNIETTRQSLAQLSETDKIIAQQRISDYETMAMVISKQYYM